MSEEYDLIVESITSRVIPTITIQQRGLAATAPRVIVLHGLFSRKEEYFDELYRLARNGVRATALDLWEHGTRQGSDSLQARFDSDYLAAIQGVVYETLADIQAIFDEWKAEDNSVGILAVSAGGLVAHAASVADKRIGAVAAIITSPDWLTADPRTQAFAKGPIGMMLGSLSPVNRFQRYPPIALSMQVAEMDDLLTPQGSILLYERLTPLYAALGISDRLELKVYRGLGHTYLAEMRTRAIDWLQYHLQKK